MYYLETFGSTDLPEYNPQYSVGAMVPREMFVETAGGLYDAGGSDQLEPGRTVLTHQGLVTGDTAAALKTSIRNYRKLIGTRQKLYRTWRDASQEWIYARCTAVDGQRARGMVLEQALEFRFVALSPVWYGTVHNEQFTLASSPETESLDNDGDATVTNAVITITAGSSAITAITLAVGDAEIQFTGTITAGQAVVVDCGAMAVTNNSADAYDDFALTANHTERHWFPIPPGSNTLTITYTGGGTGSTVDVDYYDGWH